jgi:hypothetical protein
LMMKPERKNIRPKGNAMKVKPPSILDALGSVQAVCISLSVSLALSSVLTPHTGIRNFFANVLGILSC